MSEIDFRKMLPLYGNWEVIGSNTARFASDPIAGSHGLVLLNRSVDDGTIDCNVRIPHPTDACGTFVVFRANGQDAYYAAGLGGWEGAYTLLEGHHLSATRLVHAGSIFNLVADRSYRLRIILEGQRARVSVDDVKVIDYERLAPGGGAGLGLFSFQGTAEA